MLLRYLIRRSLMTLTTLALVALAVFLLIRSVPGDPIEILYGSDVDVAQSAQLRQTLGLDDPWPLQFWAWAKQVVAGNFGESIRTGEPVLPLILDRFSASAVIILASVALASLAAVPAGMIAAWRQDSKIDFAIVAGATVLLSLPSFWLGLMLLLLFGIYLDWLPVVGYTPFGEDFGAAFAYMIMPVATLALIEIGVLTRMVRANTIEALRMDYTTHARAKGLSEAVVLRRHVFPNAFAPTMTLIGLIIGQLLGGIAVVETVFNIPGIGRLLVDAIFNRDYPVIQGCLLFIAFCFVIINLIVDLLYPLFDPRVSTS